MVGSMDLWIDGWKEEGWMIDLIDGWMDEIVEVYLVYI